MKIKNPKSMATIFLLSFFSTLIVATPSAAEPFVESDLEIGMMVSGVGQKTRKGKPIKCGRLSGKKTFESVAKFESKSFNKAARLTESGAIEYKAPAIHFVSRNFKLLTQISKSATEESVTVSIEDQQVRTFVYDSSSDCTHYTMNYKADQDFIRGSVRVGYTMPENTWAVLVERKGYDGEFSPLISNQGRMNSLSSHMDSGQVGVKEIVWASPGTEITQTFNFSELPSRGSNMVGSFTVTFSPLITSEMAALTSDQLFKKLNQGLGLSFDNSALASQFSLASVKSEKLLLATRYLLALQQDPSKIEAFIRNKSLVELSYITDFFSQVSLSNASQKYVWDVKVAALRLNYEIALSLLKQLEPYCRNTSITLPQTGEKVEVLGLRLAAFLLNRAQVRVENHHSDHISALLEQIYVWETEGKTFAEVRNDEVLFTQLKNAYKLLRNSVDLSSTPYAVAKKDMQTYLSRFGSTGIAYASSQQIIPLLDEMAAKEGQLTSQLAELLSKFQANNNSPVGSTDFIELIEDLQEMQTKVIYALLENFRFLSETDSSGEGDFISIVLRLVSQNIKALEPSMSSDFELIRSKFVNVNRNQLAQEGVNQCFAVE